MVPFRFGHSRYPNRLVIAFISFVVLILIGTEGYHLLEQMTVIDALYMTVITISTVGFGEVNELSANGRIFTIFLILGGGGIAAYSLSVTAEFFMSGEWQNILEQRRRARTMENLNDHVIICGFGRVGRRVSKELLNEGIPFIVVDTDPEKVQHAEEHGFTTFNGNAANEFMLKQAGIEKARALIAAASSDAENVFIILTARSLNPDIQIIARANYEDSEPKMIKAGANRTIVPYEISGKRMVTMLVRPSVVDFLDEVSQVGGMELLIDQVHIGPDSPLVNKSIAEMNIRSKQGVTILAIRHANGNFESHPGPDSIIELNSLLLILGTRDQLRDMMKFAKGN